MPVKDCKTEQLIKDTARRVFLTEGKMLATTQDIADAAGVNRTLLHYYFRSRDVLFDRVFKEALDKLRERIHSVILSTAPYRQKIEDLINVFFEESLEAPYLETFIILQLNQDPDKYEELFWKLPGGEQRLKMFLKETQLEMDKGNIIEMKPVQFFINLFSLMAYPFVARPLYQKMFDLNDTAYSKLLKERKKVILTQIFNNAV
ncbi:MAG TPA: TetR/AcrR family transcriptional regulator [Segetibacter sp.]|jgi:AcrR family transcriptional regulator